MSDARPTTPAPAVPAYVELSAPPEVDRSEAIAQEALRRSSEPRA